MLRRRNRPSRAGGCRWMICSKSSSAPWGQAGGRGRRVTHFSPLFALCGAALVRHLPVPLPIAGRAPRAVISGGTMSSKESDHGTKKGKASARANATERAHNRERTGGRGVKTPTSDPRVSHSRFPGETPLTSEARPADRAGGKKRGQRTA